MRTFKLIIDEYELKSLIRFHSARMSAGVGASIDTTPYNVETSARIHDLTKRLNKRIDNIEEVSTENVQPKIEGWD